MTRRIIIMLTGIALGSEEWNGRPVKRFSMN
jgi:hypothetical protein